MSLVCLFDLILKAVNSTHKVRLKFTHTGQTQYAINASKIFEFFTNDLIRHKRKQNNNVMF